MHGDYAEDSPVFNNRVSAVGMYEKVLGHKLLNRDVAWSRQHISRHDISDRHAGQGLTDERLPQARLGTGSDEPAEKDYPYSIHEIAKDDRYEPSQHHEERDTLADSCRSLGGSDEVFGAFPEASAEDPASIQWESG